MPGAIAATPVEAPIDVEEGTLPADVPLVYFYGHASPSEGPELYAHLVERLAAVLERRVPKASITKYISYIIRFQIIKVGTNPHMLLNDSFYPILQYWL